MASLLVCSEEMMEDSPDYSEEIKERNRNKNQLPPQVIVRHKELTAFSDVNVLKDDRVLPAMLQMEKLSVAYVNNYFRTVQDDISPEMKTAVVVWMFEVCEEERMHDAVFLRAVQYMDKFLSLQKILRTQLQLLGAVCLLISSKIAGTTISPRRLEAFTANSVSTEMLLGWEEMVLGMLKWDVYGVVATDFVQHILHLLPKELWNNCAVSERIKTFTAYCAVDSQFGVHLPSVIASASVAAAVAPSLGPESMNQVLATIYAATGIEVKLLKACMELITSKVKVTAEEKFKNLDKQFMGSATSNEETESTTSSSSSVGSAAKGYGIKAR